MLLKCFPLSFSTDMHNYLNRGNKVAKTSPWSALYFWRLTSGNESSDLFPYVCSEYRVEVTFLNEPNHRERIIWSVPLGFFRVVVYCRSKTWQRTELQGTNHLICSLMFFQSSTVEVEDPKTNRTTGNESSDLFPYVCSPVVNRYQVRYLVPCQ